MQYSAALTTIGYYLTLSCGFHEGQNKNTGKAGYGKKRVEWRHALSFVADEVIFPPELHFVISILSRNKKKILKKNFSYNSKAPEKKADCIKEVEAFGTLQLKLWLLFYFHLR